MSSFFCLARDIGAAVPTDMVEQIQRRRNAAIARRRAVLQRRETSEATRLAVVAPPTVGADGAIGDIVVTTSDTAIDDTITSNTDVEQAAAVADAEAAAMM